MKVKKNEKLVVKSVFKSENIQMRKIDFNKRYETYINFCEGKIWNPFLCVLY